MAMVIFLQLLYLRSAVSKALMEEQPFFKDYLFIGLLFLDNCNFSATNIIVKTINSVPLNIFSRPQSNPILRKIKIKGDVYVPSIDNVQLINSKHVTTDFLSLVSLHPYAAVVSILG